MVVALEMAVDVERKLSVLSDHSQPVAATSTRCAQSACIGSFSGDARARQAIITEAQDDMEGQRPNSSSMIAGWLRRNDEASC